MTDTTLKLRAGAAITFTSGEYSDFGTCGTMIMLKDVDLAERAQAYDAAQRAEKVEDVEAGYYSTDLHGFPAFLITSGFAMAADVQEIHLGCYSEFEPEFGVSRR